MESLVADVVVTLVDELHLPVDHGADQVSYHLIRQRQVLDEEMTLYDSGVQEGDILQLAILDPNATVGKAISGAALNRLCRETGNEPPPDHTPLVAISR